MISPMYAGPEASFLSVMTPKKFSLSSHLFLIFSFIFVTYQYAVILVIANIKQRVKVDLVVCTIVQMYLHLF